MLTGTFTDQDAMDEFLENGVRELHSAIPAKYFEPFATITTLNNWIGFSDDITAKIPEDHVITFLKPSSKTSKLYELEKEREDIGGLERKLSNGKNTKDTMNPEHLSNLFNSLNEESPKLPFDEPNSSENPNKDISEETMKDFVAMTLIFPPEIFFTLAENGIIDPNLLEDMLNYGKIKFDDTERRDKEDYGNQWRDWSPYLGDYFHDDIEDEDEEQ